MGKSKLMIIGYGRHGKDTAAEILRDVYGYTFTSSSLAACELFIYDRLKDTYGYESKEECFEDRHNHRKEWYDIISDEGQKDREALSRYILENNDIYVGCRNPEEFYAAKNAGLFDYAVWVDRSHHLPPEDRSSNQMTAKDADFILDNNGSLDDLEEGVHSLIEVLHQKQSTFI